MPSTRSHNPHSKQRSTAQLSPQRINKGILSVLTYFGYFSYPVSAKEIWYFMPEKCSLRKIQEQIYYLIRTGKIQEIAKQGQYALGGHSIKGNIRSEGESHTELILRKNDLFFKVMFYVPWVQLVGISGSCAMNNATAMDDLDVFIVSAPGRIWLARITAILCAKIFAQHRTYSDVEKNQSAHKICLNLFFDVNHLVISHKRRNLYTAHEVVQMRPAVIQGGAYQKFIISNSWVMSYFPNMVLDGHVRESGWGLSPMIVRTAPERRLARGWRIVGDLIERCVRYIQLSHMHRPTSEIITDQQLWFFPHDFGDRLRSKMPL